MNQLYAPAAIDNADHRRDNLRLIGSHQDSIIQAPATMTGNKAIVQVRAKHHGYRSSTRCWPARSRAA